MFAATVAALHGQAFVGRDRLEQEGKREHFYRQRHFSGISRQQDGSRMVFRNPRFKTPLIQGNVSHGVKAGNLHSVHCGRDGVALSTLPKL